ADGTALRSRTRDTFSCPFRKKGYFPLSIYLKTYWIEDYVDIKVNGAVHKGMPHKFYHGRTERVWSVTKRAIGVVINKQVRGKIMKKRIHVRVEHVQQSRCNEDFKLRVKKNDHVKAEARSSAQRGSLRVPNQDSRSKVPPSRLSLQFRMMSSTTLRVVIRPVWLCFISAFILY
ncbi:hypothetical protein Drorol1_Dr00018980, partial [Drosera rotundifolia]